jgi:hypothetical protein
MSEQIKTTIVSYWNKPGSRYIKTGEKEAEKWVREKTGLKMAMAIVEVNGVKKTRHISV